MLKYEKKNSEVTSTYLNIRNIISNVANVRVKRQMKTKIEIIQNNEDMVYVLTICVSAQYHNHKNFTDY